MDGKNYIVPKKYCKNCGERMEANQELCPVCGVYAGSGNRYCEKCGTEVTANASFCTNCGAPLNNRQAYGDPVMTTTVSQENINNVHSRNIVVAIILSLITCGLYTIYWFIVMTNEINLLTKSENELSGGISYLLSLVTCGIYSYFWAFQMGQKADRLNGTKDGASGILYIILMIFGLGIIAYAMIQDSINKATENR